MRARVSKATNLTQPWLLATILTLLRTQLPRPPSPDEMAKEWQEHKVEIVRLYKREGKTLRDVKDIMATQFNFHAAIRSYRQQLRKWGIRKYCSRASESTVPDLLSPVSPTPDPRSPVTHAASSPEVDAESMASSEFPYTPYDRFDSHYQTQMSHQGAHHLRVYAPQDDPIMLSTRGFMPPYPSGLPANSHCGTLRHNCSAYDQPYLEGYGSNRAMSFNNAHTPLGAFHGGTSLQEEAPMVMAGTQVHVGGRGREDYQPLHNAPRLTNLEVVVLHPSHGADTGVKVPYDPSPLPVESTTRVVREFPKQMANLRGRE